MDEKVSKKEIQKINTFSLPVPASVSLDIPDPTPPPIVVVEPVSGGGAGGNLGRTERYNGTGSINKGLWGARNWSLGVRLTH